MSSWETIGMSDEWYTPKYVFDAMGEVHFDLDVASPACRTHVPCQNWYTQGSLDIAWYGFIWMNPPFGGRNGLVPWLDKFFKHGDGIALTPDRTSCPWYQDALNRADAMLLVKGKIKFERPDGSVGKSPSTGTTLWACGNTAKFALHSAEDNGLGKYVELK